jgi:hypothetical protein
MKKAFFAVLAALLVMPLLAVGCKRVDPGPSVSKNFDLTEFNKVEIGSAFEVELVPSDTWSISITAQETLFDHINVTKSGDKLEINLNWSWGTWVSSWGFQRPKARITMPELAGLNLSGASKGTANGFRSSNVTSIQVSGASQLQFDIQATSADIDISGASRIDGSLKAGTIHAIVNGASRAKITGTADNLVLNGSGASTLDLENLIVKKVDVTLSGASHGTVSPIDTMKVSISGASSLTYTGDPSLDAIEVSGASTIHKK